MAITSVVIYDENGSELLTMSPVPQAVSFSLDNSVGKMAMDIPGYHRPYLFNMISSTRRLTIKTVLLGTTFSSSTILNQLDKLMSIMSANASTYYRIRIPFNENFSGSPTSYSSSDSAIDNAMFANGENYMQFYGHPDGLSIDKLTRNVCYITLTFTEVSEAIALG